MLQEQSFVQAIDDDFLLAAVITVVCAIPVLFLKIGSRGKGRNGSNAGDQNSKIGGEEKEQTQDMLSQAMKLN